MASRRAVEKIVSVAKGNAVPRRVRRAALRADDSARKAATRKTVTEAVSDDEAAVVPPMWR